MAEELKVEKVTLNGMEHQVQLSPADVEKYRERIAAEKARADYALGDPDPATQTKEAAAPANKAAAKTTK